MSRDGPWHIAEGSHRSHALWQAYKAGQGDYQDAFRVIVGVHSKMHTWPSFVP
jgi:hypothetical protein